MPCPINHCRRPHLATYRRLLRQMKFMIIFWYPELWSLPIFLRLTQRIHLHGQEPARADRKKNPQTNYSRRERHLQLLMRFEGQEKIASYGRHSFCYIDSNLTDCILCHIILPTSPVFSLDPASSSRLQPTQHWTQVSFESPDCSHISVKRNQIRWAWSHRQFGQVDFESG